MTENSWIPLADYSSKYRVSVSTLRRRIKSSKVEFQLDDGKYFLIDKPLHHHLAETKSAPQATPNLSASDANSLVTEAHSEKEKEATSEVGCQKTVDSKSPIISESQQSIELLLSEIKSAYKLILQEKEEQIVQLKEEVTDLKTLVRILEADNERLKKSNISSENLMPTEDWLEI